jgi:predicted molibdopterin-dependent oxidoreductase YjgC
VVGLTAAFGSASATNPLHDIENADTVLLAGSNITENHPVAGAILKRAVRFSKTRLILSDPRNVDIARLAHIRMRPAPGTDTAWINGLCHVILAENLHDEEYVRDRTEHFEPLREAVAEYDPKTVEGLTGIPAADIVRAARMYADGRAAILYCMGITQHTRGSDNVRALANLAMLCGNVGIKGGGVYPLRGQNNVQGSCDMGGLPGVLPGYANVNDPSVRARFARAWNVSGLPERPGLTSHEMLPAVSAGTIRAMLVMGENLMLAKADLNHVRGAMEKLDFLVVQDIFLTETAKMADVVLPSACFAEKEGTFTNTERRVQLVRKAVAAPGQAWPDSRIITELAARMGSPMQCAAPREVLDEIRSVVPSYAGITRDRLEREGVIWPCPDPNHPGTPILHKGTFVRGRGRFQPVRYIPPAETVDASYPLILTTGRILYHYHTGTMTRRVPGLSRQEPECFVEMSGNDARKHGLADRAMVRVVSRRGSLEARVRISSKAVDGTVFLPFHFAEAAANLLTVDAVDPDAQVPEFKVCAVRLEAVPQTAPSTTQTEHNAS